jgi:PTS system mannose-specific IIA component
LWIIELKIGVVVVTHGQLATELVNSAEMIVGDLPHFAAVSIGWHDEVERAKEEIGRAIERVQASVGEPGSPGNPGNPGNDDAGGGVLVLTDLFGGTPANLAVTFVSPTVEVITGVNLPMLIKLARSPHQGGLLALAREMREVGQNAIWVASDLLGAKRGEKA